MLSHVCNTMRNNGTGQRPMHGCKGHCMNMGDDNVRYWKGTKAASVTSVSMNRSIKTLLRRNTRHRWTSAWRSLKTAAKIDRGIRQLKNLFEPPWSSSSSSPLQVYQLSPLFAKKVHLSFRSRCGLAQHPKWRWGYFLLNVKHHQHHHIYHHHNHNHHHHNHHHHNHHHHHLNVDKHPAAAAALACTAGTSLGENLATAFTTCSIATMRYWLSVILAIITIIICFINIVILDPCYYLDLTISPLSISNTDSCYRYHHCHH